MKDLLEVEDEINEASDVLRCLDMALLDVEDAIRSPLETVLGIALRQLQRASEAIDSAIAMESPMPQREFFEVPPGFRAMVEELADLAILILDQMDGDVDLEDGHDFEAVQPDDEPSLGATAAMNQDIAWRSRAVSEWDVDCEEECEDEGAEVR